jgi:hypothetical protein
MMHVGNVHDWRRGPSEKDSPAGAALATFGVHGDSDLYAYGGSGTPGIGRDHALKLVKKYPDGSFDAISQDIDHPPHLVHIPWTGQGGEGDASSYFAIFNRFGRPSGGNVKLFGAPAGASPRYTGEPPTAPIQIEPVDRTHAYPGMKGGKFIPVGAGWGDPPSHSRGYSDPINPSFIRSWDKGLFNEGVFAHGPGAPMELPGAKPPQAVGEGLGYDNAVGLRNMALRRRGHALHILDHMDKGPPPGPIVIHDMTGGSVHVSVSRHLAAE